MLSATDIQVKYGTAVALEGVSLHLDRGEMVSLVGPNGAGKSTLANALAGLVPISRGDVCVDGNVALVPEGRQLFPDLTVDDNLRLGAWQRKDRATDSIYDLFPDLAQYRSKPAGKLSGGQQQMISIGRALMAKPDVLVIDELSLGLAPLVVDYLADHLSALNREDNTTILLIEQEVGLAFRMCSRAYLLETGSIVRSGPTAELSEDPHIREVYFGGLDVDTVSISEVMGANRE